MDKIDSFTNPSIFFKSSGKKKDEKVKSVKSRFSQVVHSIFEKNNADNDLSFDSESTDIEESLDEIFQMGEKLKESPTFENIKQYKNSIKNFFKYIVSHMLQLDEHTSGVNILKRKRFTIISVIDEKLESLVLEVLKNQKPQVELLARIDEINGLLVDLIR